MVKVIDWSTLLLTQHQADLSTKTKPLSPHYIEVPWEQVKDDMHASTSINGPVLVCEYNEVQK